MTEPETDGPPVQGAPSDAGSIADSADSDFEVEVSSVASSESSSSDDEPPLGSQDVQNLHLVAGELMLLGGCCRSACSGNRFTSYWRIHDTPMLQERMEVCDCLTMRRNWMMLTWSHQTR